MADSKLRRQLAWRAARLMWLKQETDWFRARSRAIRELVRGRVPSADLPQHADIREQLRRMEVESAVRGDLASPHPGNTHDSAEEIIPPTSKLSRASSHATSAAQDRWALYAALLRPLENVMLPRRTHPEGDALYHSLQVFELARAELPYDEEFLLAALLHSVGQALDRLDPIGSGLEALEGAISERTAWLIAHLPDAHACLEGTIGGRARRRLEENESFDELMALARCDREGRRPGARVVRLEEALAYVRQLADACEGEGEADEPWWDSHG
ncbi:MAG TPA: phosphohydrolase [Planctomycetaceae bacterium]|nr:phosphohydrolase [Planctomycetaceae bacterium]